VDWASDSLPHDSNPLYSPLFHVVACFDLCAVACVWFILCDPESKSVKSVKAANQAA
jgi:hypothetical protein